MLFFCWCDFPSSWATAGHPIYTYRHAHTEATKMHGTATKMHEQSIAHGSFCPAKGAQRQKRTQETLQPLQYGVLQFFFLRRHTYHALRIIGEIALILTLKNKGKTPPSYLKCVIFNVQRTFCSARTHLWHLIPSGLEVKMLKQ